MKNLWLLSAILLLCLCSPSNSSESDQKSDKPAVSAEPEKKYINYQTPLTDLMDSLNITSSTIEVHIDKSDYTLRIISGEQLIKEYPCVFGGNPKDDKLREGDQCTPEGEFRIVTKYPHKSWSKFIWINYPTNDSWRKHNAAKANGDIPKDANIGGEIGIHGVPGDMNGLIKGRRNWTLGCISLTNPDVNEIYPYFTESTRIVITP